MANEPFSLIATGRIPLTFVSFSVCLLAGLSGVFLFVCLFVITNLGLQHY